MLPINFHKTFVPERRLIGELLHYAALGKEGDYQEISSETGIPMGKPNPARNPRCHGSSYTRRLRAGRYPWPWRA